MSNRNILAPLDEANLRRNGLLHEAASPGSRRLHKRRLNRSSDEDYADIPLDIPLNSLEADNAFVTIPATLVSHDTLVYLGLSEVKAAELWDRWNNWPSSGPRRETDPDDGGFEVLFVDFVTGSFGPQDVVEDSDTQWRACLSAYGLAQEAQEAIMDPYFTYLRLSESCHHWAKDTVEMRYAGLRYIQEASYEREADLQRGTQATSASRIAAVPISDIWSSASAAAARNAPGVTLLYKGLDEARIQGLFDNAGALSRLETLLSSPPSGFGATRAMYYFTTDYTVAKYYATYARRRNGYQPVTIVCLRIPNAAIEGIAAPETQRIYWPSDEWKELVWRCRTQQPIPSHLRKYRQATLIIGTISRKPNGVYLGMRSWEDIADSCVLRVAGSGRPAVQYVFSGEEEGRDFLAEHGTFSATRYTGQIDVEAGW